jgi:hypothetical protein
MTLQAQRIWPIVEWLGQRCFTDSVNAVFQGVVMGRTLLLVATAFLVVAPASASGQATDVLALPTSPGFGVPAAVTIERAWNVSWGQDSEAPAPALRLELPAVPGDEPSLDRQAGRPRPVAIEYTQGHETRLKIHRMASYATLPLLVAEYALGRSLYNTPAGQSASGGTKTAHAAVAGSIVALFGVNTVTGIWNLRDERKDPAGRTRRMIHGILMLMADGEFAAAAMLTPRLPSPGRPFPSSSISPATHRAIGITAIGTATVGYVMMLLWRD